MIESKGIENLDTGLVLVSMVRAYLHDMNPPFWWSDEILTSLLEEAWGEWHTHPPETPEGPLKDVWGNSACITALVWRASQKALQELIDNLEPFAGMFYRYQNQMHDERSVRKIKEQIADFDNLWLKQLQNKETIMDCTGEISDAV